MGNYATSDLERLGRRIIENGEISMHGFDSTPLCEALFQIGKDDQTGIFFEEELASNPTNRSRWFVDGLGVNGTYVPSMNDRPDNARMLRFGWLNNYAPVVLNTIEAKKYTHEDQLENYVMSRLKLGSADHKQEYARSFIHADGTANDIIGLRNAINFTGTYGDLTRKFFPAIIGHVADAGDVASATADLTNVNNPTVTKGSNVMLISGDDVADAVPGRDIFCQASGLPDELRSIVASDFNTTNVGFTTIYVDRPFNFTGTYTSVTVQDIFPTVAKYGAADLLTKAKIRRLMQRCKGKVDVLLSSSDTWGDFMSLVDDQTRAITQEERKQLGVRGFHKALNFDGAWLWIDDHMPSGELIGTKFSSWNLRFLDGFEFDDFERDDKIIPLVVGGGGIGLGLEGYVMINVVSFGTSKVNQMFRLTGFNGS